MNHFHVRHQKNYSKIIGSIALFCAVLLMFVYGMDHLSSSTNEKEKESLENALQRDITYCYAMEGKYPDTISDLKERYGLVYDESRFYIDYRNMGSNIYPDVTIIEREEDS